MHKAGKKFLFAGIGLACTFLAIIGVILPGVPATVFIIIAFWALSNSSDKLHAWMLRIPILRPAIKETHRFQREKTIDVRIKLIAQAFSWGSFAIITLTMQNILLSVFLLLAAIGCSLFMFFIPSTKPKKQISIPETEII